ncbi:MAG TPA: O-antigen ligase family protein [Thermomicrobiales bacterium]|nr:O-antigen ligase family protein [Thermomicrobiales bacterium]
MVSREGISARPHWRLTVPRPPAALVHRFVVFTCTLLGLLGIGFVVLQLQARGAILPMVALCGITLGALIVIRPVIGLAALVTCAIGVRVSVGTGSQSPLVASLLCGCLLLVGWFVHRTLNRQRLNLLPSYVAVPAVLALAFTGFSLMWGRLTLDPRITYPASFQRVQIAATVLILVSVSLLFVCADLLRDRRVRTAIVSAMVVTGFLVLPFKALGTSVPGANTAGLFGLWFIAICWANALVNHRLHPVLRGLLATGAVGWLLMATIVEGKWVSGWLPGMVALLLITLWARPLFGIVLALLSSVLVSSYFSLVHDLVIVRQREEGSLDGEFGRLALWQRNVDLLGDHLLLGTGPAGYAMYYITFIPDRAMSTHNNYFDMLAQTGVTGLLSFVGLMVALWVLARRVLRHAKHAADRAVSLAVVGGVPAVAISLFLGDWLLPFVYNQTIAGFDHSVYSWLMFAMVCGLYVQQRHGPPANA